MNSAMDPMSGLQESAARNANIDLISKIGEAASAGSAGYAIGGGLLLLALVSHVLIEYRKLLTGSKPDFGWVVVLIAIHAVLLTGYGTFSSTVLGLAGGLGGGSLNATDQIGSN